MTKSAKINTLYDPSDHRDFLINQLASALARHVSGDITIWEDLPGEVLDIGFRYFGTRRGRLYRGITVPLEVAKDSDLDAGIFIHSSRVVSCWSWSETVASEFASFYKPGECGLLLSVNSSEADVMFDLEVMSEILVDAVDQTQCLRREEEVIVAPGVYKTQIIKIFGL